jgi:hypothetical protein
MYVCLYSRAIATTNPKYLQLFLFLMPPNFHSQYRFLRSWLNDLCLLLAEIKYEESANFCPAGWETVYEIDTRQRPFIPTKGCVLNATSTRGSFYDAQKTCRRNKSALIPLSPRLYRDPNVEGPSFAYPTNSK